MAGTRRRRQERKGQVIPASWHLAFLAAASFRLRFASVRYADGLRPPFDRLVQVAHRRSVTPGPRSTSGRSCRSADR